MRDFDPIKRKLSELLSDIDNGKIQLPNFQRDYKWTPNKVKKLIDSIQAGYPAGSLLFLEVDSSNPLLQSRPFEFVDKENVKTDSPEMLVLDGQQRLTSCFYSFYNCGTDKDKSFYLNYGELFKQVHQKRLNDYSFEDYIVVLNHDSISDSDCRKKHYLPFSDFKDRDAFRDAKKKIIKQIEDDDIKDFLNYELESYLENIFDYQFPVIKLDKELSLEAVCKIFETINTTGLKLSSFDICVAKFMREDLDLRKKMDEVKANSEILKRIFDEDENILLQAIALLAGKSPKANALPKNLEKNDIKNYWDKAIGGFSYIVNVLDRIGVGLRKNTLLLPYKPVLPLFAALSVENEINDNTKIELRSPFEEKIKKFFFASSFSNRYTEGTDAKIQKDFFDINNWIKSDIVPAVVDLGLIWDTEKYIGYSTNSAFGKSVLCLINNNHPTDFYTTENVGNFLDSTESQLHHLFPKANYSKRIDDKRLNTIFNFTFITSKTNNYIKDADTSKYLKDILIDRGIDEETLKDELQKHFIDDNCYDSLINEDFEKFIHQRAELIKEKLSKIITVKNGDPEIIPD